MSSALEQRIQALEDIEAIKQLKARYWFACDMRSAEDIRRCFSQQDLLIDFGFVGQFHDLEAFIEIFTSLTSEPTHIDTHHGLAPEIQITGPDAATGRWRMSFQLLDTETLQVQLMSGSYQDDYIKVDGEWKIKTCKYTIHSNLLMQADEQQLKVIQASAEPGLVNQEPPN